MAEEVLSEGEPSNVRRLPGVGETPTRPGTDLVPLAHPARSEIPQDVARPLQELWFQLSKRQWRSLVVVPANENSSTGKFARSLAAIGNELSETPVASAALRTIDAESARSLAILVREARDRPGFGIEATADFPAHDEPDLSRHPVSNDFPLGKLVIGMPSVVSAPVGLGVTEAADCILLGIKLGETTIQEVKRSMELMGRERIMGCVLI